MGAAFLRCLQSLVRHKNVLAESRHLPLWSFTQGVDSPENAPVALTGFSPLDQHPNGSATKYVRENSTETLGGLRYRCRGGHGCVPLPFGQLWCRVLASTRHGVMCVARVVSENQDRRVSGGAWPRFGIISGSIPGHALGVVSPETTSPGRSCGPLLLTPPLLLVPKSCEGVTQ